MQRFRVENLEDFCIKINLEKLGGKNELANYTSSNILLDSYLSDDIALCQNGY